MFSREYACLLRERLDELVVNLLRAPRQHAVLVHELAVRSFFTASSHVARQLRKRMRPVGIHVDEVPRRFLRLPARRAPQVRIDRVLDDGHAVFLEERSNLRRQQRNGAIE